MLNVRFEGKLDYIIDNIDFVNVQRNANYTFPYKNGKEKHSVIFVEHGEIDFSFINTKRTASLNSGDIIFIPKKMPYIATYKIDNTIIKILNFDIISNSLPDWMKNIIHKSNTEFFDIYSSISGQRINSTTFLVSKIYEILCMLEEKTIVVPQKYKTIIPALKEIENSFFENKKMSYYSDMCHMSESNFRKLFKEYTGKSPIEYRNFIRIFHAHKLINSGEYTVQEAARLSGFNNMCFFYETYKRFKSTKAINC